jgi:DNA polymerase-1
MDYRVISFDTETALILTSLKAPPMACLSYAERVEGRIEKNLVDPDRGVRLLEGWLRDDSILLVNHTIAYDLLVCANHAPHLLPLLFRALEMGRIHCTEMRERIIDLSHGQLGYRPKGYYTLDNLSGGGMDKTTWRYGYGKLIRVPFGEWPQGARDYALTDAEAALRLWEKQGNVVDTEAQTRASFAFRLMETWGMRTDPERVAQVKADLKARYMMLRNALKEHGVLRDDGSQNMALTRELIEKSYPAGRKVPRTPTGAISTGSDVIESCDHPGLVGLVEFKHTQKMLQTYIPAVERGTEYPVCPSINVLVNNGRTSCREPNLQNLPRDGAIRECFVPRAGKVFVDADYDTLEVRTFAQVLHDLSIGDTLKREYQKDPDFDPHCRLAAQILGITYEEAIARKKAGDKELKDTRQMSKAGNFGLAGGMGAQTFVTYAFKSYGVVLDLQKSKWLKREWMRSIPEVQSYFNLCTNMTSSGRTVFEQLRSGRIRGGAGFTDLANGFWSGLAADGAKHAQFNISKACYVDTNSPLYGSRPVMFVHDEYIIEADAERGHEAGQELARICQESMEEYTPDVPSRASPQLMNRWYKGAEPAFDNNGRLIPWEPEEVDA